MKVETGVIAAAGSGTRMLPVTLAYPKELVPIVNKPAIQLIIEEFIDSGIKKVIIVTGANPEPLLRQYGSRNQYEPGKYKDLDAFRAKIESASPIKRLSNSDRGCACRWPRSHGIGVGSFAIPWN